MRRRVGVFLLVAIILATGIFLYSGVRRGFELTVTDGDKVLLQKNYNIRTGTRLKVFFLHNNDYLKFYEQLEDKGAALGELNSALEEDISKVAESIYRPPKDAKVLWDKREFTYDPEADGVEADKQGLIRSLFEKMDKNIAVGIKKLPIRPLVTVEDLKKITEQTASFSTNYSTSSPARKHNINLAVSFIDGTVLQAGERFSFNKAVGPRTVQRGFLEAKIIYSGQFVKGIGGGVCQVSTTLYNAVIRAGLKPVNVCGHSLPVGYVPLSFDAMVSSANDFEFENNSGYPVYIKGECDGNNVKFTFYGINLNKDKKLVFRSEILRELPCDDYEEICDDSLLAEGELFKVLTPPKSGYVSEGYMDIYEGGKLTSSVRLRRDTYQPQKGVRIVRAIYQDS